MTTQWVFLLMAGFFAGFIVPHPPIDRFGRVLGVIVVALMVTGAFVFEAVVP